MPEKEKPDIHENKEDYQTLLAILRKYSEEDIADVIAYAKYKYEVVTIIHELTLHATGLKNVK